MSDARQKALAYAFLLLKFRLRSQQEVSQRLLKKKFEKPLVEEVISFLRQKRFLDDAVFARAWIQARLKRPFGLRRIARELQAKGVAKEIMEAEFASLRESYQEEDSLKEVAVLRLKQLQNIEPKKARARLYQYLLRRGFAPDAIMETVGKLIS